MLLGRRILAIDEHRAPARTSATRWGGARGAWHTRLTATRTAGVDGRLLLNVVYTGRGVIGVNLRLHASMARDADHIGGTSPWRYFRVTS